MLSPREGYGAQQEFPMCFASQGKGQVCGGYISTGGWAENPLGPGRRAVSLSWRGWNATAGDELWFQLFLKYGQMGQSFIRCQEAVLYLNRAGIQQHRLSKNQSKGIYRLRNTLLTGDPWLLFCEAEEEGICKEQKLKETQLLTCYGTFISKSLLLCTCSWSFPLQVWTCECSLTRWACSSGWPDLG